MQHTGIAGRSPSRLRWLVPAALGLLAAVAVASAQGVVETEAGYLGVVVPRARAELSAEVGGAVLELPVRAGDRVEAGDLLAQMDPRAVRQDLAEAEAALAAAKADSRLARQSLEAARGRWQRRQSARKAFAEEDLAAAEAEVARARAEVDAAEAEVQRQRARVAKLRDRLQHTAVRAPFAGTVAARYVDPGATVAAGEPLVRVIDARALLVRFAVPPEKVAELTEGQRVRVTREGGAMAGNGRIAHIAPELDSASQTVFVEAELTGDQAGLRIGTTVRVAPDRQGGRSDSAAGDSLVRESAVFTPGG